MIENNILKKKMIVLSKMENMMVNNIMQYRQLSTFKETLESSPAIKTENIEEIINPTTIGKNYEWLEHETIIKPYYDIDLFYVKEKDFIKHKKIDGYVKDKEDCENKCKTALDEAVKKLSEVFPEGIAVIADSCGEKSNTWTHKKKKTTYKGYAVSYHIVILGYECKVKDMEEFNEKVGITKETLTGYDKSVYSNGQNFRALYSAKANDKRVKKPYNYENNLPYHIIQSNSKTNLNSLSLPNSPAATPPQSPKKDKEIIEELVKVIEKKEMNGIENIIDNDIPVQNEEIEFQPIQEEYKIKERSIKEITDLLETLKVDEMYEYDNWIKVGLALFNIFKGSNVGKILWFEWSKCDNDGFDSEGIDKNWINWKKKAKKNPPKKKVGFNTLKKFKVKYQKLSINASLESIFIKEMNESKNNVKEAEMKMLNVMNTKVNFIRDTGSYISLGMKKIRLDDEAKTIIEKPCWFIKSNKGMKDELEKEEFIYKYKPYVYDDDGDYVEGDDEKTYKGDPFKTWSKWIDRKEFRAIGFDPCDKSPDDIFNLWNGFNISKETANEYEESQAQPILDHIFKYWCNSVQSRYDYVMNLFAHYIQKPYIKTGVLLSLKSKEGGGKGIILDKLAQIIGDDHYAQNSNASYLFGDFNGQLEGKILINLDEAYWGGDKKMEGVIKNKITERRQTINKKNKEAYNIDDYANYIITTNNDWFVACTEDGRRVYALELNDELSGRQTEETLAKVQPVLDAPAEAFAKVLYNRDISDFKPRIFKKTPLVQEQVERGWNSVKSWYNKVMKDGGFTLGDKFIEWNTLLKDEDNYGKLIGGLSIKKGEIKKIVYFKDWIFSVYDTHKSINKKFDNPSFYRDFQKDCLGSLYEEKKLQIKKQRRIFILLPSLEDARKEWNKKQQYDYQYENEEEVEEWVLDNAENYDMSDSEEE